ncbi:hypothetical protein EFV37_24955 [Mesorhizobium loti]|uniref:Uncharacterized protein n=1 Tax=Mesorhizobium jarvisii TaxID=1777867 RepID=A0A6M7TJP5_9HYPH|nr:MULTISPECIES: DUF6161 domain-containing protein [Mesorhizobium]OBQ68427.1 hypothetical protein A9K72_09260 [Mesorhizobium loti]QKC65151.1 hypothetical protein EB229_24950 [Mesorhizobium jarvisii]QKD11066.1 hypothetical protein EFV37_24955 [Mesorhizobium loti]RJT31127.1 hypothetical protein D3242_22985 [Mesorhizobium jarvisii]
MEIGTYRIVRSVLRDREYAPGGPNAREAISLYSSRQLNVYQAIINAFYQKSEDKNSDDSNHIIKRVIEGIVQNATANAPAQILEEQSTLALKSTIPVVTNANVDVVSALKLSDFGEDNPLVAFAGGLVFEIRNSYSPQPTNTPIAIVREMASYAAWRAIDEGSRDQTGAIFDRLNQISSEADQAVQKANKDMGVAANNFAVLTEQLRTRSTTAIEAAERAAEQVAAFQLHAKDLQARLDGFEADIQAKSLDAEEKLSSFLNAAQARTAYRQVVSYWSDRATDSWRALVISSLALAVFLIGLPILAVLENDTVINFLKHLTDATNVPLGSEPNAVVLTVATVSRLVVITIPLALYFWLIKLLVRFNIRSMLLMDDARQRETIIETYYKMIEQEAATKEDRSMILQALCRPPPGHGGDNVEPPSVTDIIERAVGKSVS